MAKKGPKKKADFPLEVNLNPNFKLRFKNTTDCEFMLENAKDFSEEDQILLRLGAMIIVTGDFLNILKNPEIPGGAANNVTHLLGVLKPAIDGLITRYLKLKGVVEEEGPVQFLEQLKDMLQGRYGLEVKVLKTKGAGLIEEKGKKPAKKATKKPAAKKAKKTKAPKPGQKEEGGDEIRI